VTQLDAAGDAKYREAIVKKRQEMGPMPQVFRDIPGLPEMPVEIGQSSFNPFSGQFVK
jgi:hypothetical protein